MYFFILMFTWRDFLWDRLFQEKIQTGGGEGGLRIYFSEKKKKPWNFSICHFNLRNSGENKLAPLANSTKLCDNPGNSKVKNQDSCKFYFFFFIFNRHLEFPHAVSSIPLETPCLQPPLFFVFFFWNSLIFDTSMQTMIDLQLDSSSNQSILGYSRKKSKQEGWGHGISRGIEVRACGNSRGQLKKNEISRGVQEELMWNFHGS